MAVLFIIKNDGGDTDRMLNKKDAADKSHIAAVLYIILYYAEAGSYRLLRNFFIIEIKD